MKAVLQTIVTMVILAFVLPTVSFASWTTLIIASVVFTILFNLIRPILKVLLFPINLVTLGLASALLNIVLLWLVTYLVPGFHISEMTFLGIHLNYFWTLAFVSTLIGFTGSIIKKLF